MINRSGIKYTLMRILPKSIFFIVVVIWQKFLLRLVELIDSFRIKNFKEYHLVTLTHRRHTFKLYISPENGFIDKHIFLYGVYEPFMLDLFSLYLTPGGTFVDIGANIGQHTIYAASVVGETGSVYSFEPIPSMYKQLSDSVLENNFQKIIHTYNYALGQSDSTEELFISKNIGGSSLIHQDDTKETITVSVKKGDAELMLIKKIDLIKIDVEGYEFEVLTGMQETLITKRPALCIEFSGELYHKQNLGHGKKILSLLRDSGYTLFDIEDDMRKIIDDVSFEKNIVEKRKQTNLLCIIKQQ